MYESIYGLFNTALKDMAVVEMWQLAEVQPYMFMTVVIKY